MRTPRAKALLALFIGHGVGSEEAGARQEQPYKVIFKFPSGGVSRSGDDTAMGRSMREAPRAKGLLIFHGTAGMALAGRSRTPGVLLAPHLAARHLRET